ncbi:MAG: galactose-1-phosphate uridylyltransferase [Candidatus Aenigmatarchaeota archaeon]|nr:MAG: galactose-1-phosphate uridylyltransferase [Candidatus Aenigmarchaeota archaeon]
MRKKISQNHIRRDIFEREVIIAGKRSERPGASVKKRKKPRKEECPFCPGNEKLTGSTVLALPDKKNWKVRIFPNKFPVVFSNSFKSISRHPYKCFAPRGRHEVMVETRDHNHEYEDMKLEDLSLVFKALKIRYEELMCMKDINYVTVFKNRGKTAGASIPHTHMQIIASPLFPEIISREMDESEAFFKKEKKCGICTVVEQELKYKERVVTHNSDWICINPYSSSWPYQIQFMPKRHFSEITDADDSELENLARIIKKVFMAFSKIFEDLPLNIMYHNFPKSELWHFQVHLYPRLMTQAGFEFFGLNVNTKTPEEAAAELREAMKHLDDNQV